MNKQIRLKYEVTNNANSPQNYGLGNMPEFLKSYQKYILEAARNIQRLEEKTA